MIIVYGLVLFVFSLYSYCLVDPNLTFINSPVWTAFREWVVRLGYFHRDWSFLIYILILLVLYLFHRHFLRKTSHYNPLRLAIFIGIILLVAYPFLSHDFFNYLFDAKILTYYHQNPYLLRALDFPTDPWIRFMHWTHRTYPYGPLFLLVSLVPSFLSGAKFIVDYFLFKFIFVLFYILAVFLLSRIKKVYGLFFATNPLVIVEGLMNNHNDLIAVSLGIVGVYCLLKKSKAYMGTLFLILSFGIKYLTLPFIFLSKTDSKRNELALGGFILLLAYLFLFKEWHPWYFLNLFVLIPFFDKLIFSSWIFTFGLLFSYYPYIRFGEWAMAGNTPLKHIIMLVFLGANIIYVISRGTIKTTKT